MPNMISVAYLPSVSGGKSVFALLDARLQSDTIGFLHKRESIVQML